jgi:Protein of unknown function (DUF2950)
MTTRRTRLSVTVLLIAAAFGVSGCANPAPSAPAASTFDSPDQAAAALFEAVQKDDQPALVALFGPESQELIWSGDAAADREGRDRFIERYTKMHRIGLDSENRTALVIGAENWPFPIPLTNAGGRWRFDTGAGKAEVLYRRVGRNEMNAIATCEELAAAEKEYFLRPHDGQPAQQYAQHMVSREGKRDGLFWQSAGDEESPIGSLLAFAGAEATAKDAREGRVPFHGYFYRLLKSDGAASFLVDGRMTRGFAFLAYPAEYRSSGVMTFVVGADGVVYEKDLGADGMTQATALTGVTVDGTWQPAR